MLYSLVIDAIAWAKQEDREAVMRLLEWPEVVAQRDLEESDRMARDAMDVLGIDPASLGIQ